MHITKTVYSEKEAKEFLLNSDKAFDQRVDGAVEYIINKGARFLCLSGPSCSGKTTTADKITQKLKARGISTHVVSIDDFFFNMDHLVAISRAKGVPLDMDSSDAIDLTAFSDCLEQIVSQSQTLLPIFDFHTHTRSGYKEFKCDKNDLIIFEGIQAVYPEITELVAPFGMASIFVCPDQAITVGEQVFEPNIFRFYRRIVRDAQYRSSDALRTLEIWRGVRNNEDANIFPHRDSCEYILDSTMAYDLHLLTPYLRELLPRVPEQSRYYLRALDILNRISDIKPIPAEFLCKDSLYREFIRF